MIIQLENMKVITYQAVGQINMYDELKYKEQTNGNIKA